MEDSNLWLLPSIISALAGIVGVAAGGFTTYKISKLQEKKTEERKKKEKQESIIEKIIEKLLLLENSRNILVNDITISALKKTPPSQKRNARIIELMNQFDANSAMVATWIEMYFDSQKEKWSLCINGINKCMKQAAILKEDHELERDPDWSALQKNFNEGLKEIGTIPMDITNELKLKLK